MSDWTFVTKHAMILSVIARNPDKTAREISTELGITERTAHKIITDLDKDGYITKTKTGVRNTYRIHPELPMKNTDSAVGELLALLAHRDRKRRAPRRGTEANG